jgi:hypothetical protein
VNDQGPAVRCEDAFDFAQSAFGWVDELECFGTDDPVEHAICVGEGAGIGALKGQTRIASAGPPARDGTATAGVIELNAAEAVYIRPVPGQEA